MNDILMITHADDLDGRSCAIIIPFLVGKAPSEIDIAYEGYKTVDESICKLIDSGNYKQYNKIIITDLGIKSETAKKIDNINGSSAKFEYIDHHESNKALNKYEWAEVKWIDGMGRKISATKLLFHRYSHMVDLTLLDTICNYANIVSDYDTFTWLDEKNITPKKFHVLLAMIGHSTFVSLMYARISDRGPLMTEDENKMATEEIQKEEEYIVSKLKTLRTIVFKDYRVGVIFDDNMQYVSMLGNRACEEFDIHFAAIVSLSWRKVNLRTVKNDINLGVDIATQFGGGGHPRAAGFELTVNFIYEVMNKIFGGNN